MEMAQKAIKSTQYLSFILNEEVFAFDISKVREVLDFTSITHIPRMPAYMRGVINLRGGVVPVLDLRLKFGMGRTENNINTCIIIVEVAIEDDHLVIGALADSVEEVFDLKPDEIEPAPRMGTQLNTRFLNGMGKKDEKFVLLLDIDKVFSTEDLDLARQAGDGADLDVHEGVTMDMRD